MEDDRHIFVSPDAAQVEAQEGAPREVLLPQLSDAVPRRALQIGACLFSLFFRLTKQGAAFSAHRQGTAGPREPTDAKPTKPFWHFTEHLKWCATVEGQRQLAKYPQVKPRSREEEEQHQAFGRRIMARYEASE